MIGTDTSRKVVRHHPNASLATTVGSIATLILWAAGAVGIAMNAEQGALTATVLVSASLFVGRRGIRGVIRGIINGFEEEEE